MVKKYIVIAILFASFCLGIKSSFAFSAEQHAEDYQKILAYLDIYVNKNNVVSKKIQSMIDSPPAEIEDMAKDLNGGKNLFAGGGHRVWGHWGLRGKIPKDYIKKICGSYDINSPCYKKVSENWKKQVKELISLIQKEFNVSKKEAKAIATVLYNTHILGDYYYSSSGKHLIKVDKLVKQIVEALKILGEEEKAEKLLKYFEKLKKEGLDEKTIAEELYKFIFREGGFSPFGYGLVKKINLLKFIIYMEKDYQRLIRFIELKIGRALSNEEINKIKELLINKNYDKLFEFLEKKGILDINDIFVLHYVNGNYTKVNKILDKIIEDKRLRDEIIKKENLSKNEAARKAKQIKEKVKKLIKEGKFKVAIEELNKYDFNNLKISKEFMIIAKLIKIYSKYHNIVENFSKFAVGGVTYGVLSNVGCMLNGTDENCIKNVLKDTFIFGSTYMVLNALFAKLPNGRFGIISRIISKGGGPAVFAFFVIENGKLFYSFSKGYISEEKLIKDIIKRSISLTSGAIVLILLPEGLPVIAAAIFAEFGIGYVLDKLYPDTYDKQLIFMDISEISKFFGIKDIQYLTTFNLQEFESTFNQVEYKNSFNLKEYKNTFNPKEYPNF